MQDEKKELKSNSLILQIAERLVWLPYVPIMVCNFPLHVSANMRLPIKKERIFWG